MSLKRAQEAPQKKIVCENEQDLQNRHHHLFLWPLMSYNVDWYRVSNKILVSSNQPFNNQVLTCKVYQDISTFYKQRHQKFPQIGSKVSKLFFYFHWNSRRRMVIIQAHTHCNSWTFEGLFALKVRMDPTHFCPFLSIQT